MKTRVDQPHDFNQPHPYPTLGQVNFLRRLVDTSDLDYASFCRALSVSPLIESTIIRTARSAGNGRIYEISDLQHAISLIGLNRVREILSRLQRELERDQPATQMKVTA